MDTGVAELYSMSTQATNTGDNLKLWIDTIGIRKRVLEEKSIINHSNLYRQFKADKVDWHLIAKMHNYLREFYDYNIRDFFPDFPEKLDNTMHVEFVGTDEKLKRLATDRDIGRKNIWHYSRSTRSSRTTCSTNLRSFRDAMRHL